MTPLATAYAQAHREGLPAMPPGLESTLAALYARGRAAHTELRLDEVAFAQHLAVCGANVDAAPEAVHAEDLFLVCAALGQDERAITLLCRAHDGVLKGYLRRVEVTPSARDEIERRIWEVLLVGDAAVPAKLASYSGRGQLAGFIGICAQRIAVTSLRRSATENRALARARAEAIASCGDPELMIIKERYRDGFESAVQDAVAILDDRERLMLRMLVVDGHTLDRIAEVYGVNQSSISRWLAKARQKVVAEARRLLRERLNIPEAEFESLAKLILSQIDISASHILHRAP
jgi:RNA polymerase sigma-70 factor (ECF subfamily)